MYNEEQFLDHTPLTEEEALGILPDGDYKGFIKKIEVRQGKKDPNKSYFVANVDVFNKKGKSVTIVTWLALDYMVKHMYDACGIPEKYNKSRLSNKDCEGKTVTVKVKIQKGNDQYPTPKNVIFDFLPLIDEKNKLEEFNDDVPF